MALPEIVNTRVFAHADRGAPDARGERLLELAYGPVIASRLRCTACGNLARCFDVVTERRVRAFHHFSVGGALSVEDEEVLDERIIETSCRWCGHGRAIEVIDAADVIDAAGAEPPG